MKIYKYLNYFFLFSNIFFIKKICENFYKTHQILKANLFYSKNCNHRNYFRFNETFDSKSDVSKIKWNLDHDYNQNFNLNDHPYRAMAGGEQYGFGAELLLNSSEHQFVCDGTSKGFIVSSMP